MSDDIFALLEPAITERLGAVFRQSEEYKQAVAEESAVFEQLREGLTEEQKKQLDEYFTLLNATAAVCERLTYRQGMKDLAAFGVSLLRSK
mgnify:CR=1 FL=1